jgi:hypothetical protein
MPLFYQKAPDAPKAGREFDIRLAFALGWDWHPVGDGLSLLCPPPDEEDGYGFFYDVTLDEYQFVPRWSTSWADAGALLAEWGKRYAISFLMIDPRSGDWFCDIDGILVEGALLDRIRAICKHGPQAIAWSVCQAAEALAAAQAKAEAAKTAEPARDDRSPQRMVRG